MIAPWAFQVLKAFFEGCIFEGAYPWRILSLFIYLSGFVSFLGGVSAGGVLEGRRNHGFLQRKFNQRRNALLLTGIRMLAKFLAWHTLLSTTGRIACCRTVCIPPGCLIFPQPVDVSNIIKYHTIAERGLRWRCMDPISLKKIEIFLVSRRMFWSYPVSHETLILFE